MLGKRCGVAIQIYKKQPKAHYTHCHCHSLNLSIKDVTRSSKMLSDVMDTTAEISVLLKFSPKHEKLLENLKEQLKDSEQSTRNKITKLSTTRWTVRASALLRIIENYSYIMELWNECLVNENLTTEIKSRVNGCQSQMGIFHLFFGIHLGHRLYSHTENLLKSLQSEMSAASSKRLANLTVSLFQSLRVEECFESFYNAILKKNERIVIYFRVKVTPQTSCT